MRIVENLRKSGLIFRKDLLTTLRKLHMLVLFYGLYVIIAYIALKDLSGYIAVIGEGIGIVFSFMFMMQTSLILSIMLLPMFVYPESMSGKHEIYFAYGFGIVHIVLGKSMILGLLTVLPAMAMTLLFCSPLMEFSSGVFPGFLLIWPLFCFALICLNVFMSWFSKAGRFFSMVIIMIVIMGFSRIRGALGMINGISANEINMGILFLSVTILMAVMVMCRTKNREGLILEAG